MSQGTYFGANVRGGSDVKYCCPQCGNGAPTAETDTSVVFYFDQDSGNLWWYDGNTWVQQTGGSGSGPIGQCIWQSCDKEAHFSVDGSQGTDLFTIPAATPTTTGNTTKIELASVLVFIENTYRHPLEGNVSGSSQITKTLNPDGSITITTDETVGQLSDTCKVSIHWTEKEQICF